VTWLELDGARADAIGQSLSRIAELDPFDFRETEIGDPQIRELADAIGIKRIASTMLLDRIATPTAYCVRPSARHPCAMYSSGKGFDARQAVISSVFECYERWAAERAAFTVRHSLVELLRLTACYELCILEPEGLDPSAAIDWALGRYLCSERCVAAPASYVEFPGSEATTTGLAAHSSRAQAVANAFFECVERHQTATLQRADLHRVCSSHLSCEAQALAVRLAGEDIELHSFVIDPSSRVKTVYCFAYDHWLGLPQLQCSGFGASTCVQNAADRALLEVAQSRAAFISGLRADVAEFVSDRASGQQEGSVQREWLDRLRSVTKVFDGGSGTGTDFNGSLARALTDFATEEALTPMLFPMRSRLCLHAVRVVIPELIDCR
jgi:YcaO-like protein with predicted kinase domain